MKKYLLAIDAGTGSGRAVLFDLKGNQLAIGQREWSHKREEGVADSMEFECEKNWGLLCECIKEAVKSVDPKDILAVSATSMREGIVLYDEKGKELWAVANVDARASKEVKELKELFTGIEEHFYEHSGQTFALGALPRLLWLKKNRREIYDRVHKISMISDWVLARLCGVIASDPSNAGTSGIFSLSKREWESSFAKRVGIKDDIFPPVYECGEVIGEVISNDCGLSKTTKVVMGGGDVQLGSAGLAVVKEAQTAILGGTFWQQVVNIKNPKPPKDMSIRINPHVVKGLSQAEGITFFSGMAMRWFKEALCQNEIKEAKKLKIDTYELLERKALDVPVGSYGILPIFSDVMRYGKWYHASPSFLGLGLDSEKYNIASMFRSLEENAAIVSAENLENISRFSEVESDEIVFAGGASKGFLWPQILSSVCAKAVKVPKVKEATALGCAIAAGVGAGIYKSVPEGALELVEWEKSFEPNMKDHQIYKEIRYRWKRAYESQLKLVDENITEAMWKAPGL